MNTCGYLGCESESETTVGGIVESCYTHAPILNTELRQVYFTSRLSRIYSDQRLTTHSSGLCYIIELRNGNLKIGYSGNEDLLYKRFQALHRDNPHPFDTTKRIKVLAVVDGGETMEAVLHDKFSHLRIRNLYMEQFTNSSEILLYAKSIGINDSGKNATVRYSNYTPKS